MEEECEEAEGNSNGVLYAVAVKIVEITDFGSLFSVYALERYDCVQGRLQTSVSRSAKRKLESLCTLQHSWEKLRIRTK